MRFILSTSRHECPTGLRSTAGVSGQYRGGRGRMNKAIQGLEMSIQRAICVAPIFGLISLACAAQTTIDPHTMPKTGQVDPRFVSYNIEAVEITGGRFWKPYSADVEASLTAAPQAKHDQNQPVGMDPKLFQYRKPIDLGNPRLLKLASALAPAYIRVSGTWRNSTYFQDNDDPAMPAAPKGFNGVLTRTQWKGVVDFSHATGAEIVTSVATSAGTRDTNGFWTPGQAKALFDFTKSVGGRIAATEFMNEPTYAEIGGAPRGYDSAAFAKDAKLFKRFLRSESPDTIFLGPGGVGEGPPMIEGMPPQKIISTEGIMKDTGPIFDIFSYHFYGTVSRRCTAALGPNAGMSAEKALSSAWLDKNKAVEEFYAKIRDAYLPGKAMWLTETGEAGCGGDRWAAEFIDSFRYLDQLGSLAQKGVQIVMQNTLASSDYGLLDEETLDPRPNYWSTLLWKQTMGMRVLDPGVAPTSTLRIYAHCMKDNNGGVSVLALNLDRAREQILHIPISGERYSMTAPDLLSKTVSLNGVELKASADGSLPKLYGQSIKAGNISLAPLTITFIVLPAATNGSCK